MGFGVGPSSWALDVHRDLMTQSINQSDLLIPPLSVLFVVFPIMRLSTMIGPHQTDVVVPRGEVHADATMIHLTGSHFSERPRYVP